MVNRVVPGRPASEAFAVTPAEVAAAKLQVKRAKQRGKSVPRAIDAIANAAPQTIVGDSASDWAADNPLHDRQDGRTDASDAGDRAEGSVHPSPTAPPIQALAEALLAPAASGRATVKVDGEWVYAPELARALAERDDLPRVPEQRQPPAAEEHLGSDLTGGGASR